MLIIPCHCFLIMNFYIRDNFYNCHRIRHHRCILTWNHLHTCADSKACKCIHILKRIPLYHFGIPNKDILPYQYLLLSYCLLSALLSLAYINITIGNLELDLIGEIQVEINLYTIYLCH